jgi:Ankyrin repeats (3 copies)/MYND finger
MGFDCRLLNRFAMSCFIGNLDAVMQVCFSDASHCNQLTPFKIVESGRMDRERLQGTETEFEFGYASLVVLGSQRVEGESCYHDDTLKYLLSRGVPPDVPDICGHTALHHTMIAKPKPELARILVKNGANVDAQERYGGVPLLIAFRINVIEIVELLLNAGAALDIPDANGTSPKSFYLSCGPEVTAVVSRWIRKRKGEEAPREEGTCGKCGKKKAPGVRLKQCSKCHSQLYCSADCQRQISYLLRDIYALIYCL